jgi:Bor protein
MKNAIVLAFLAVVLSGCFRLSYKVDRGAERTYKVRQWNNYFLFGIIPADDHRDLEKLCPGSKLLEVRNHFSPANILATLFSLGLSSATTTEYTCTFPDDLVRKSAGQIRKSVLSGFGLGGSRKKNEEETEDED